MNEKEISEIRRRFRPEKGNFSRIRGCFVNEKKEIVSDFNKMTGLISRDDCDNILAVMKKTLSGTLGKNLIDVEFSVQQVMDSDEHRLIMALRDSALTDEDAVAALYDRISQTVVSDTGFLILLATDTYDVFSYGKDGSKSEDSAEVFTYFVCCVCPVKQTKPQLGFSSAESVFYNISENNIVSSPEIGFMFPSFDDRAANIYNALMYTKNISENPDEFASAVFNCTLPMPAAVQKETFGNIISDTVADECNYKVAEAIHDEIAGMIEEHKASKSEEPLKISKRSFRNVLQSCGVNEEKLDAFEEKYDEQFGANTEIRPQNIVDTKQFELHTPDVTIKVNPDRSDLVKTKVIDGTKYILIRADENVEVNGVNIQITE